MAGTVTGPLEPAELGESPSGHATGVPYSARYDDVYHAVAGAWAQARHVFLGGNGLPLRWQGRHRFVVLETGFGLGNNFLATWSAWLDDPARCDYLYFVSIEKHPLRRDDLARVHAGAAEDDPDAARRASLSEQLLTQWPALVPGWHTLRFEHPDTRQRITLLLGLGDVADLLPHAVLQADAFYLDGFAPAKNPDMWDESWLSRLGRLAAPGATAATWSSARSVRGGLTHAGFTVERVAGFASKRDMVRATYTPRHVPAPQPGGLWPEPAQREAVVVGTGLAGCTAAWALVREGWDVTLVDRHPAPAQGASGNPGGLFHSILHADDGVHARAHRAAALSMWQVVAPLIRGGQLRGGADGLLRLDAKTDPAEALQRLAHLGLPADHVEWLTQPDAATRAGLAVPSGGWLFHQAGWLHPAGLAQWLVADALDLAQHGHAGTLKLLWQQDAAAAQPDADGGWQLLSRDGHTIAQAPTLVLASADETPRLLATLSADHACDVPPLSRVRGQVSWHALPDGASVDVQGPRLPVAGSGYVLRLDADTLLFGATTQHHDDVPLVRAADHRHNLQQAARLGVTGLPPVDAPDDRLEGLAGRVGWRATTPDRLPLIGAVAQSAALREAGERIGEQVRLQPRWRGARGGLFLATGLGSRGITWSILAGELLAHWVTGRPCPVEGGLRNALDPARFLLRARKSAGAPAPERATMRPLNDPSTPTHD